MAVEHDEDFMQVVHDTAQEVLELGKHFGFGMCILEIKFTEGVPRMVLKSFTDASKPDTTEDAISSVAHTIESSVDAGYQGARTFTVVFDKRGVNRILGDNYQNINLGNRHAQEAQGYPVSDDNTQGR